MSRTLLYAIVFIEGFCSLGGEVIALRRLVPHVGSSIVVTAPTIGFFLLALALGYAAGAKVAAGFEKTVARNFLMAAALAGLGLARVSVDGLFLHLPPWLAYTFFIGGILCPLAYLLGQTVPILTNLMQHARTGEASGYALYWSTLGSFLGSISLSLLVMQWLGVSAAVLICALLLVAGSFLLGPARQTLPALACAVASAGLNLLPQAEVTDTAYADYAVPAVDLPETREARAFKVNNSVASLLDESDPPRYARYVQHLRHILLEELAFEDKSVLVLGAGGFTLSHREPKNHYSFVDIDPAIRDIAEKRFLRQPARGEFIVGDARRHVGETTRRYDAVVVDVYSSHTSIPSHLVTREFWRDTRQALAPQGVLLANLILDGRLETPYARNLLATVESIYGRCAIEVLHKDKPLSNVILTCFASSHPAPTHLYQDELSRADTDLAASR